MRKLEWEIMHIINIVNIEDEPIVTRSYTTEAFLNMCNNKLHTNYTIEEINKATRAFLNKYNYLEIHICPLITEEEPVNKYKQALDEIEDFLNGACNACKEFTSNKQSYIGCRYCQPTQILNIIKRAKEK